MHHGRHHTGHTHQGKVLVRQLQREYTHMVDYIGKEKAGKTTHIQTGGKRTTHTATSVGSAGGQHLHQNDEGQEEHHHPHVAVLGIEQTAFGQLLQVVVQQAGNGAVALAIEWRQQEDGETEDNRAEDELFPRGAYLAEDILHAGHHPGEVERDKAAEDTQEYHIRDTGRLEGLGLHETKLGAVAREDI